MDTKLNYSINWLGLKLTINNGIMILKSLTNPHMDMVIHKNSGKIPFTRGCKKCNSIVCYTV